jgi:hypothetical protein
VLKLPATPAVTGEAAKAELGLRIGFPLRGEVLVHLEAWYGCRRRHGFSEAASGAETASALLHNAGGLSFRGAEAFRAEDPLVARRGGDDFRL